MKSLDERRAERKRRREGAGSPKTHKVGASPKAAKPKNGGGE